MREGDDEGDDAPEYLKAAAETWSGDALAGEDGIGGGGTVWKCKAKEGGQVTAFDGAPTGLQNVPRISQEFGVTKKSIWFLVI